MSLKRCYTKINCIPDMVQRNDFAANWLHFAAKRLCGETTRKRIQNPKLSWINLHWTNHFVLPLVTSYGRWVVFQYLCPVYSIGLQLSTARIHWSYRKSSPKVLRFLGHDLRQVSYTCCSMPVVLIHSLGKAHYTTHHNWHFYVSRK